MKFQSSRIKDISKEVGFSPSTVSRALRDSHEISEETKKIILACAERLHYRPNPMARGLRSRESQAIAIIISEISNAFFSQVISGVESVASELGYNIIILQSSEGANTKMNHLDHLTSSIDGLLISVSSETEKSGFIKTLHEKGLPIVFFDRIIDEIDTHKVVVDNNKAAYIATKHLAQQGFKRIAAVVNGAHKIKARERMSGYKKAIAECYLQENNEWIKQCMEVNVSQAEVDKQIETLLNLSSPPDAIAVLDELLTKAVLKSLQSKNIRIPEDVAIVGFSNSDFYELLCPPLTIVCQPAKEIGRLATELLIKLIKSKRPPLEYKLEVLEPELIIRKSSEKKVSNKSKTR